MPRLTTQPEQEQDDPRYPSPMVGAGMSPVQRRFTFENANRARSAALFAAAAPPSADPMVNRMRSSYIDSHDQTADFLASSIFGPHYFQNRDFADAANERVNATTHAAVNATNAQTNNVNALTPGQAAILPANA